MINTYGLKRPLHGTGNITSFRVKTKKKQQNATNLMFIVKHLSQHVSCIIMPIFRRTLLCTTAYGVNSLALLKMGIMMPQTCWDRRLTTNIRLVAVCWFLSLHSTFMMHGHKSLKSQAFLRNFRLNTGWTKSRYIVGIQ